MGCGVSKDDIAEPSPMDLMQAQGRNTPQLAAQASKDANAHGSTSLQSLAQMNKPPTPPSVIISESKWAPICGEDKASPDGLGLEPGFVFPLKARIEEVDDAHGATALALLSGGTNTPDEEDDGARVVAISASDVLDVEGSEGCSTCAMGMLSRSALLDALVSTSHAMAKHKFSGDFPAMVGSVTVIAGPDPGSVVHAMPPLRKAEIIDLDEEQDSGALVEEPGASFKEQCGQASRPDGGDAHQGHTSHETRKSKLPPLNVAPSSLDRPADPFVKPAFPTVVSKSSLVHEDGTSISPSEYFADLSARTATMATELAEAVMGNIQDIGAKSPTTGHPKVVVVAKVPLPLPLYDEWASPQRDVPDPDIENIILLESQELDSPLIPMLDCHGIHKDNVDLISPLHLIP